MNGIEDWDVIEASNGYVYVRVTQHIRCNATGENRQSDAQARLEDRGDGRASESPNEWWWSDGNAACDCNRAMFFAQAADEPDPNLDCGHGAYSVRLANPKTGEVFYDEFEDEA